MSDKPRHNATEESTDHRAAHLFLWGITVLGLFALAVIGAWITGASAFALLIAWIPYFAVFLSMVYLIMPLILILVNKLFGDDLAPIRRKNVKEKPINRHKVDQFSIIATILFLFTPEKYRFGFHYICDLALASLEVVGKFVAEISRPIAIQMGSKIESAPAIEAIAEMVTMLGIALSLVVLSRRLAVGLIGRYVTSLRPNH